MPFSLKNYSSLTKITDGGMSELFLAIELLRNRVVVIKKLTMPSGPRNLFLERFQNEVRNVTFLSHDNIISITDFGIDDGDFYIVMEFIDGCDFNTLICDDSFDRTVGLMIVVKALQALSFSHANGIIHCDIKPANLLIDRTGRVVLTDFGLSMAIDNQSRYSDFATPLFMPPEQAYLVSGQTDLELDQLIETSSIQYNRDLTPEEVRTLAERGRQWDIWSVGVLLYRVCTGCYPFYENNFADLLKKIIYSDPLNIIDITPDVPTPIIRVIGLCLQKEPYLRPQTLDPVINVLLEFFNAQGIFDIDGIISTYMQEKSDLLPIHQESESLLRNISRAAAQPSTTQLASEWELNEYVEQITLQNEILPILGESSDLPGGSSSSTTNRVSAFSDELSAAPNTISAIPDEPSSVPNTISAIPDELSAAPNTISAIPDELSAAPNTISAIPDEFSAAPDAISAIPDEFSAAPDAISAIPDEFSAAPNTISAIPDELSAAPNTISAIPDELSAAPNTISAIPDEFSAAPDIIPAIPDELSARPTTISASKDKISALQSEPAWEYYEYKTLRYKPPRQTSLQSMGEVLTGVVNTFTPYIERALNGTFNGIRSFTPLFNKYRTQLTYALIVLASLSVLVVSGVFISKAFTAKQHRVVYASHSAETKKLSDTPQESKSRESDPLIASVQETTGSSGGENIPDLPSQQKAQESVEPVTTLVQKPVATVVPHNQESQPVTSGNKYQQSASQVNTVKQVKTQKTEQPASVVVVSNPVATATEQPGVLKITIDPPEARVYVEGKLLSQDEIVDGRSMSSGSYKVSANAPGYQSYSRTVLIESDKTVILALALKPDVKGNGQLHIYSYPWANLYVDGELMGTTPTPSPLLLVEGVHNIALKRDGYQELNEAVTVSSGDIVRLKLELKKAE